MEEGTPFQPAAYLLVGGAPGLGATSAASHGSGSLDVIIEETTEMTVMTDEESKSEATPLGALLMRLPPP